MKQDTKQGESNMMKILAKGNNVNYFMYGVTALSVIGLILVGHGLAKYDC